MIFSNGLDDKVRNGTKTQTRRLVKDGEYTWLNPLVGVITEVCDIHHRLKWQVGKTYAIQSGRGKKGNGRFRITKIRRERLLEINCKDCIAEGLDTRESGHNAGIHLRDQFARLWDSIHKKPDTRWEDNPLVWCLEIEHVAGS